MPYPPIPRDPRGTPIPVVWNDETKNWEVHEGSSLELSAIKTELELVKTELETIKQNQLSGDQKVQLSGTMMELYGATVAERPSASSVPVGATYMAVDSQDVWQSNGINWVVM